MPLCVSLSTLRVPLGHFAVYFSCARIYALHSALALRMPLCISLSIFPARASLRFPLCFPCARLYAFHCLLCACLHAVSCLLSLRMHLCISLCTCPSLRTPLRVSLSTFPMQLSCAERNDFTGRTLRNAFGKNARLLRAANKNRWQIPKCSVPVNSCEEAALCCLLPMLVLRVSCRILSQLFWHSPHVKSWRSNRTGTPSWDSGQLPQGSPKEQPPKSNLYHDRGPGTNPQ